MSAFLFTKKSIICKEIFKEIYFFARIACKNALYNNNRMQKNALLLQAEKFDSENSRLLIECRE